MKKYVSFVSAGPIIFSAVLLLGSVKVWAQDNDSNNFDRDTLIAAAREIMETSRYCALITLDKSGHPQARTMDPFLPGNDMVVWLGTNKSSRKVGEIRNDSRVTLYYEAPDGSGYAVIQGNAYIEDGQTEIEKYWKEEWDQFYPDKKSTFALIKVVPKKLEIISYKYGITGSSKTWAVPHLNF
jgi:general stress protein 26